MDQKDVILAALKDRFNSLPQSLQDAITSSNYQQKLLTISQKYKLSIEQLATLEQETTMVLLGLTLARDYAGEIKDQLKLSEEITNNIVTDINSEIFVTIKDILMDIEEDADTEDQKQMLQSKEDEAYANKMSEENKLTKEARGEIVKSVPTNAIRTEPSEVKEEHLNLSQVKLGSAFSAPSATNTASGPNLTTPGNNPPAFKGDDAYREKPE